MYAVIQTGGKQIKVEVGQEIYIEKIAGLPDELVTFNEVLLIGGKKTVIGTPFVKDANVVAKVIKQGRAKKIIIYKFKAKKNYRKKQGHRQAYTKLLIEAING